MTKPEGCDPSGFFHAPWRDWHKSTLPGVKAPVLDLFMRLDLTNIIRQGRVFAVQQVTETGNPTRGYSLPMRILHWVMAAAMIFTLLSMPIAQYIVTQPFYDLHRAMGFVLLALVVVRLFFKFTTKAPSPLPDTIPPVQKFAANATHILLYGALTIHPFLGWYATNAWGVKNIPFFGIWTLPQLTEKNRELGNQLLAIHHWAGYFILALVVLHVSAALYHHYIRKDGVLERMLRT